MNLQVNRIAYPVTTLGPGRRVALWVQGCSRRCPGCASSDTWDPDAGDSRSIDELVETIEIAVTGEHLDGLSVTGGEPAEQSCAVAELINQLRQRVEGPFDALVFSGYKCEEIEQDASCLMGAADAMVCGPYDETQPRESCLIPSANQELVVLNEGVRGIYEAYTNNSRQALQFDVSESGVYFVGMPNAGDLGRLEKKLAERGIELGGVSWNN